jgi:nitrogen regulatory protein PII
MDRIKGIRIFKLIYVIVNQGMGSKILRKAKDCGITGGTIVLAKGTVSNALLNFLSLNDERKEMVLMAADCATAESVLEQLNKKFHFAKPNHGIAFTTRTGEIFGSSCIECRESQEKGAEKGMYQMIVTIVDRGNAETVIEAAQAAGAMGGTIVNARGSGIHETGKLFNMEIEPEKEMVYILSKREFTEKIIDSIREKMQIAKPGKGIVFVQDVNDVYGLYE